MAAHDSAVGDVVNSMASVSGHLDRVSADTAAGIMVAGKLGDIGVA